MEEERKSSVVSEQRGNVGGVFALICWRSLLFTKWPFPACSVMSGSLMAAWCCLKSGCRCFCWVIRKIVWWKDIQEGGEENRQAQGLLYSPILHTSSPTLAPPPPLFPRRAVCAPSKQVRKKKKTQKTRSSPRNTFQSLWRTWGIPPQTVASPLTSAELIKW